MDQHNSSIMACGSEHGLNKTYGDNEFVDQEPKVQKQARHNSLGSLSTVSASSESQKQYVSETEMSNAAVATYAPETAFGFVTIRYFCEIRPSYPEHPVSPM